MKPVALLPIGSERKRVSPILHTARTAHQEYHAGQLSLEELQRLRPLIESQLEAVLSNPPWKGWAGDAIGLSNRLKRHWDEWFTFLTHPEVKPDNNDAERALRPVVIHRQVSGGARSDWGAQLVAQMFSFLETMRLQGSDAIGVSLWRGRSPDSGGQHLTGRPQNYALRIHFRCLYAPSRSAIAQLCELLSLAGRSPPGLHST